jgi:hypothetical protein
MLSSSGNYKISYKRFLVNGTAHLSNDILEGSFVKINTRLKNVEIRIVYSFNLSYS